jgi:hypothetical protein
MLAPPWLAAICIVVALVLSQWWLAAILAIPAVFRSLTRILPMSWLLVRERDDAALAHAVAELPEGLRAASNPTSTIHLVAQAAAERPDFWENAVIGTPDDDDGGTLAVGETGWTVYAAEAVAFAWHLHRDHDVPLDRQTLAVCAASIPGSAAERWLNPGHLGGFGLASELLELDVTRLSEAFKAFAGSAEGAGIMQRIEAITRGDRSR